MIGNFIDTHGCISLTTQLEKHYNDLLDRGSFVRSRDKVTYVGDVFCIYILYTLALPTPIFKKTSLPKRPGKSSKLSNVTKYNEKFGTFFQTFQARFFIENWHTQSQGIYKKGP